MKADRYQKEALRTAQKDITRLYCAIGLAGEAGEYLDYLKKVEYHGHPFDPQKAREELGDIAWYLAVAAHTIGANLGAILEQNIAKLKNRYPNGFSEERSRNREDENWQKFQRALQELKEA